MSGQELQLKKPAWGQGYYWGRTDDGPLYGPFDSHDEAAQELWDDGFGEDQFNELVAEEGPEFAGTKEEFLAAWEWIGIYEHGPVSTDVFSADYTLECLEDRNECQVWHDSPPDWPQAAKRELEQMLGGALYRWLEKHNLWSQFRGLS